MNQAELARELNVSQATISQWSALGLPFRRIGKRRTDYDIDEARAWCLANWKGLDPRLDRPGHMSKILQPAATAPAAPRATPTGAATNAVLDLIHRAIAGAGPTAAAWIAVETECTPAQAAAAWFEAADALGLWVAELLGIDALDALASQTVPAPSVEAVAAALERLRAELGSE